ncbi:uncharacterized protein LOC135820168 [Sycon ciliatum]|uniref:uncharacterized protein LOC135820168 n=1 Tax=Sycon ciliatum TaxID=27933 RepID=UPI0031F63996
MHVGDDTDKILGQDVLELVVKIICPQPTIDPDYGSVSISLNTYRSVRQYSCGAGYLLNGSTDTVCMANAQWSGSTPTCQELPRCKIPHVSNAVVSDGTNWENSVRNISCNEGFELAGNSVVVCLASGFWSSIPICNRIVVCKDPLVANGNVSQGQNNVGSSRRVMCNAPFELQSDKTIVCTSDGTWSSNPMCNATVATSAPSFFSQSASIPLITLIGGLGVLFAIAVTTTILKRRRSSAVAITLDHKHAGKRAGKKTRSMSHSDLFKRATSLDLYGQQGRKSSSAPIDANKDEYSTPIDGHAIDTFKGNGNAPSELTSKASCSPPAEEYDLYASLSKGPTPVPEINTEASYSCTVGDLQGQDEYSAPIDGNAPEKHTSKASSSQPPEEYDLYASLSKGPTPGPENDTDANYSCAAGGLQGHATSLTLPTFLRPSTSPDLYETLTRDESPAPDSDMYSTYSVSSGMVISAGPKRTDDASTEAKIQPSPQPTKEMELYATPRKEHSLMPENEGNKDICSSPLYARAGSEARGPRPESSDYIGPVSPNPNLDLYATPNKEQSRVVGGSQNTIYSSPMPVTADNAHTSSDGVHTGPTG